MLKYPNKNKGIIFQFNNYIDSSTLLADYFE